MPWPCSHTPPPSDSPRLPASEVGTWSSAESKSPSLHAATLEADMCRANTASSSPLQNNGSVN
jgi:hypothetical protein